MAKDNRRSAKKINKQLVSPFSNYWTSKNYIMLAIGVIVAIVGFLFMTVNPFDSFESLYISPILLVLAFLVIIPYSIFVKDKKTQNEESQQ